ncbi:MAG: hypothetical protein DRN17_06350 [Thermoplasmata archaeon]|nr:MAG: hypothetical protein DRN17_06350 [Thermoplasmata archaeon]
MAKNNFEGSENPSGNMSAAGGMPANKETDTMLEGYIVKIDATDRPNSIAVTIVLTEKICPMIRPLKQDYTDDNEYDEQLKEYYRAKQKVAEYNERLNHLHIGRVLLKQPF